MTPKQFVKAYKKHGSIKAITKAEGLTYHHVRKAYLEAVEEKLIQPLRVGRKTTGELVQPVPEPSWDGQTKAKHTPKAKLPKKGKIKRYLLTCAQNNTYLHEPLWDNLLAFAEHMGAELLVSRFAYQRSGLNRGGDKAIWADNYEDARIRKSGFDGEISDDFKEEEKLYGSDRYIWAEPIYGHLSDSRMELAPGLVWCGEWQRNPTTANPLSGFQVYTGHRSGIFPHTKLAMESVPQGKFDPPKFNYTTGTVTLRNYIQKGAGLKAEFHHCYGAALVEVDHEGDWFVRQISADSDGTFYDLDLKVQGGVVTTGHAVEAITFGDIHVSRIDKMNHQVSAAMMDDMSPRYAFYHDILDFERRNHHEMHDPFRRFELFVENKEDVREEVGRTMEYVANRSQHWRDCQHVVVDSNHDRALEKWLRQEDWKDDPVNMMFYIESVWQKLDAIANGQGDEFHMLKAWWKNMMYEQEWLTNGDDPYPNVTFLDEDEPFRICDDDHGGIECGMHGHLGANGARGNIRAFAKMGRRANIGHSHQAGIHEGIWQAGTSSLLDMKYNKGMSSWSHSHIITYENGKRAMLTVRNGKYRAGPSPLGKDGLYDLKEAA
jgi:hypothetical protein